jgi:hypothetical protein
MKDITINGKTYSVVFDLQTMINYENITGRSFFDKNFHLMHNRIALLIAAIISANKDADIDSGELIKKANYEIFKEIILAFNVVMDMAGKFFEIPSIEPKEEKSESEPKDSGEDKKN